MVQANQHGAVERPLAEITGEKTRLAALKGDAVLTDAHGAGRAILRRNPLRDRSADWLRPVESVFGPIHRARRVPRVLAEVARAQESNLVWTQALEAAVIKLFGPHAGDEITQVFHELAVLERADFGSGQRRARDFDDGVRAVRGRRLLCARAAVCDRQSEKGRKEDRD